MSVDAVLLNDWQGVARASDRAEGSVLAASLLGEELALWRAGGRVMAWRDRCAHRGTRLSLGTVTEGGELACAYHGWRYGEDGACVHIPAQPTVAPPAKARAKVFRAREAYGFIWVSLGEPARDVPPFPEWDDPTFRKVIAGPYEFHGNPYRTIENFTDVPHFPFVHPMLNADPDRPNVFEDFDPELPPSYREARHVFLANIAPQLQLSVLDQVEQPRLVALDTMNYWIEGSRDALVEVLGRIDILVINDEEARQLADEYNLVRAAETILAMGPSVIVIKRGEHGATAFLGDEVFTIPGYPLRELADPAGAGDSFAGGFMGHLVRSGEHGPEGLRRAIVAGSVMASFCVEEFSLGGIRDLDEDRIATRYRAFQALTRFGDL